MTATLTSPDLAVGEEIEIEVADGSGTTLLTIVGGSGGGGGGNFWPFDTTIPATAVAPILAQAPATAAGVQPTRVMTQSAFAGSGEAGGALDLVWGMSDGAIATQCFIGVSTALDTTTCFPPFVNFNGWGKFEFNALNTPILTMGLGTNGSGAGIAGSEISAFGELNLATEGGNAIINVQPIVAGARGLFQFGLDPVTGSSQLQMANVGDAGPGATAGILALPWGASATLQLLLSQRNENNTDDLQLITRNFNELYWGSFQENSRFHALDTVLFEILNPGGSGWAFSAPNGFAWIIGTDSAKTVKQGASFTKDGWQSQLGSDDTVAAAPNSSITDAPFTPTANAVTRYVFSIIGVDQVTQEWTTFTLTQAFASFAGVVTAATGVAPTPQAIAESTPGLAAGLAIALVIAGPNVSITVTPWSANDIHWIVRAEQVINTGTF